MTVLTREELSWVAGSTFTRFTLIKTRWFSVLLHRATLERYHPRFHTHPWSFLALVLRGGYHEKLTDGSTTWRGAGSLLWRPYGVAHSTEGTWWSLVITGPKRGPWQFVEVVR